jgi:thiol-disulfide isomerase/thioredoxin
MRRPVITLITFFIIWQLNIAQVSSTGKIPVVNFKQIEPLLHYKNDSVYFVNFWATWCVPCRQELPAIQKVGEKYAGKKFRIILVSLDLPNLLESRLMPFIQSNQIKQEVLVLNDPDQNSWIDKVDPGWTGEIPFTLIYGRDFREPHPGSFRYNELDSIINLKMNAQ